MLQPVLGDFAPVSIKMAKEQGLSLNPTKISGTCGRLMCCLKYEQEAYEDLLKNYAEAGRVRVHAGRKRTVVYVNMLKGKVKVNVDGGKEKAADRVRRKGCKGTFGRKTQRNRTN